jgi:hypothetical protein
MKMAVLEKNKLHEAFEEEAKDINIEDLMAQMMESVNQEKGYVPTPADEIRIRKMMLAKRYIDNETVRLAALRDAVNNDWNARIKKKQDEAASIMEYIEMYIKNVNGGKKLSLDVGTATLRRSAPKVKLKSDQTEEAKSFLQQHGQLEAYLKPAPLDASLLQNAYMKQFNDLVEAETEKRIKSEVEASEKGKITKKREGEIKLEVEQELADSYYKSLPDFFEYVPETKKISITMK